MAIKRLEGTLNVVQAAQKRIKNIFKNGLTVYMSFSGGKDSLCLANVVLEMIQRGEIDPSQLVVQFIDEEAIYDCIEEIVKEWRKKFLLVGAKFYWYCMQYRHFNCFNSLENDESFICWDETKRDRWVRQPPSFAIRHHPLLRERKDTYQMFLTKRCAGGIAMTGVRVAESIQRLDNFASATRKGNSKRKYLLPIYDWKDVDVWRYIYEKGIKLPDVYMKMWRVGLKKRQLRVSQFFSVDTARCLVKMNEYYPDLMERVVRREPNAYLATLYWDSEMFGRNTSSRKAAEKDMTAKKDYKKELGYVFSHINTVFTTGHKRKLAKHYRNFYLNCMSFISNEEARKIYEALMAGDPKARNLRSLYRQIYGKYIMDAVKEEGRKNG